MTEQTEPLLQPTDKLTIYPIIYPKIWKMYKKQEAAIWFVEEVDLSTDYSDWLKMNDDERHFISYILAFFAASDTIVNVNLIERFINDVKPLEAKFVFLTQASMENRHSEAYSLLIDTYIRDLNEKDKLFNAVHTFDVIKKKKEWCYKYINGDQPFSQRLLAFCIVEGLFFSASFASIYWLRERGLLQGFSKLNHYIARDEGLHTDFSILLYSMLNNKLDEKMVSSIFKESVELEINFICKAIPCRLLGINTDSMIKYIKYVADNLLSRLGYSKIYNVGKCPLDYMEKISMQTKVNFFSSRVTEYQVSAINDQGDINNYIIDDDF